MSGGRRREDAEGSGPVTCLPDSCLRGETGGTMDVVLAVQQYVARMTEGVSGMKALLLDRETTAMVSMVISRSQVLEKEVFLFQRIDAQGRGQMLHLKAIVFLRPTRDNIELLAKELMAPLFGEYHLFFSNVLSNDAVRTLAQADTYELVQQVREVFADFYALSPSSFTLALPANTALTTPLADRARDGLFALLLALKKKPVIRYQASSRDAERLAALLSQHMDQQQEVLDFGRETVSDAPPLLLLLDRSDDPVTPLLNQWTYQVCSHPHSLSWPPSLGLARSRHAPQPLRVGRPTRSCSTCSCRLSCSLPLPLRLIRRALQAMVHELLGIRNNVVELPADASSPSGNAQATSAVLSPVTDEFFREHMLTDYGAMNDAVHNKLEELKRANPSLGGGPGGAAGSGGSIQEMQRLIEKFPEMTKMKDNVSKHINILHYLSKLIDAHNLLEVSELEQQLAAVQDHKAAHKQVSAALLDDRIRMLDKLRLVLLYALRYQKEGIEKGTIDDMARQLPRASLPGTLVTPEGTEAALPKVGQFPELVLRECGAGARTPQSDLFNRGVGAVVNKGLNVVINRDATDNAYMLHQPMLDKLLKLVDRARLPEDKYPYRGSTTKVAGAPAVDVMRALKRGPPEIIVFYVGGATYAEARVVDKFNKDNRHSRVVLGGTCFLSTATFLESVAARAAGNWSARDMRAGAT